jgi:putative hydrolase of the HAD superfamily
MVRQDFAHITTWVFDLDNTLYHPSAGLFAQMDVRFAAYVMRITGLDQTRALRLAHEYWEHHGSTLAGLMAEHDIDPDEFLADVHDIDITHLTDDPALDRALAQLDGRKIVYTNGSSHHAKRVLAARGLTSHFDAVYGVEHANYRPKPGADAFTTIFARDGVTPTTAAMFEDEARNLAVPHDLGMRTVHVHETPQQATFIHHGAPDLAAFLSQLAR